MKKSDIKAILQATLAFHRGNPTLLSQDMPNVAKTLDNAFPCPAEETPRNRAPHGLTEHERQNRVRELEQAIKTLGKGLLSQDGALRAVEDSLVLAREWSLPQRASHKILTRLVEAALAKPLKAFDVDSVVEIRGREREPVLATDPIVRGVECSLTWDHRVIRVSVYPAHIRERLKAMAFVGSCPAGKPGEQGT